MKTLCLLLDLRDQGWLQEYLANAALDEVVVVAPTFDGKMVAESLGIPYVTYEDVAWALDKPAIQDEARLKSRYWHELPELKSNFVLQSVSKFMEYPLFIMHQSLMFLAVSEIIQAHRFIHQVIEREKPDSVLFGDRKNPFMGQPIGFITGSSGVEREILKSLINREQPRDGFNRFMDDLHLYSPALPTRAVDSKHVVWPAHLTGPKILIFAWGDYYLEYFKSVLDILLERRARICIVIIGGNLAEEQQYVWNEMGICSFHKSNWSVSNQEAIWDMWRLKCEQAVNSIYNSRALEEYFSDEFGSYYPGLVSDFLGKQILDSTSTVISLLQSEAIAKTLEPDMVLNHFCFHPFETCDILPARLLGIPTMSVDHGVNGFTNSQRMTFATQFYGTSGNCFRDGIRLASKTPVDSIFVVGNTRYDAFQPSSKPRSQAKADLGLDPARPLCIFTDSSGWSHTNNWRHSTSSTVKTILSLKERFPELQIIFRIHHGADYSGIKLYFERLGNADIRFQLSPNPPLVEILPAADVLVSHYSSSIAEALLVGVPVIYLTTHTEPEPSCFCCEAIKIANSSEQLNHRLFDVLRASYSPDTVRQLAQPYFDLALKGNDGRAYERLSEMILELAAIPPEQRKIGFQDWIERVNSSSRFDTKEFRKLIPVSKDVNNNKPFVSIIIPTYNRDRLLGVTLKSFVDQNYPKDHYEIIVADNNSSDLTKGIIEEWQAKSPVPIVYVFETRQGAHNARNTAAKQARGEILYFTDDDMIADADLLEQITRVFDLDPKIGTATGRVLPQWEVRPPEWIVALCSNGYLSLNDQGEGLKIEAVDLGVWSCHQAIRREAFFQSGGYNPDIVNGIAVGDNETGLNIKLKKLGYKFAYNGKSVTYHIIPKGRMTQNYLNKRLAQQGGCDSYGDFRKYAFSEQDLITQITKHHDNFVKRSNSSLLRKRTQDINWHLDKAYTYYYLSRIEYDFKLLQDEAWRKMVLNDDWINIESKYDSMIEEYTRGETAETEEYVKVRLSDFGYSNAHRMDSMQKFQREHGYSIIPVSYFEPVPDLRNVDIHSDHTCQKIMDLQFEFNDTWIDKTVLERADLVPEIITKNPMIAKKDLQIYGQFIDNFRPNKIIEIGSGYSACFAYMFCNLSNIQSEIISIEPSPNNLLAELSRNKQVKLIQKLVQDINPNELNLIRQLDHNDILFIDASHITSRSSDTNFIFINLIPMLKPGVLVHVHDIFLPYDYPNGYYTFGRFYNEQYLLAAMLANSTKFKPLYSSYYNYIHSRGEYGGSFWMKVK